MISHQWNDSYTYIQCVCVRVRVFAIFITYIYIYIYHIYPLLKYLGYSTINYKPYFWPYFLGIWAKIHGWFRRIEKTGGSKCGVSFTSIRSPGPQRIGLLPIFVKTLEAENGCPWECCRILSRNWRIHTRNDQHNSGPRGRNNLNTGLCTQDDGSLDHVTKKNLTYTSLLRTYTFVLATPTKNRADKSNQTKVIKQNKTIQSCSISILGGCSTLPNCPSQDT